jgi:hypothetical protein
MLQFVTHVVPHPQNDLVASRYPDLPFGLSFSWARPAMFLHCLFSAREQPVHFFGWVDPEAMLQDTQPSFDFPSARGNFMRPLRVQPIL